ncbi:MAG: hypothetical protein WEB00_11110 [Dehalococcoidia bacterium]
MTISPEGRSRLLAIVGVALAALAVAASLYLLVLRPEDKPDCSRVTTAPVTEFPVTPERYEEARQGLREVQSLTEQALAAPPEERTRLLDQAFEVFYESSDNLMHDADRQLCEADYDFAGELRDDMFALEVAIGNQNNPEAILDLAETLESRLVDAEEVLFG